MRERTGRERERRVGLAGKFERAGGSQTAKEGRSRPGEQHRKQEEAVAFEEGRSEIRASPFVNRLSCP